MANSTSNPDDKKVNPVILDAVKQSTMFAFGSIPSDSEGTTPTYNAGEAIAYEKVAQACAYMVQDATDYQRNILSVNGAAQGKALALMFTDPDPPLGKEFERHALILVLAMIGSFVATLTAGVIGTEAGTILSNFPPKSGG